VLNIPLPALPRRIGSTRLKTTILVLSTLVWARAAWADCNPPSHTAQTLNTDLNPGDCVRDDGTATIPGPLYGIDGSGANAISAHGGTDGNWYQTGDNAIYDSLVGVNSGASGNWQLTMDGAQHLTGGANTKIGMQVTASAGATSSIVVSGSEGVDITLNHPNGVGISAVGDGTTPRSAQVNITGSPLTINLPDETVASNMNVSGVGLTVQGGGYISSDAPVDITSSKGLGIFVQDHGEVNLTGAVNIKAGAFSGVDVSGPGAVFTLDSSQQAAPSTIVITPDPTFVGQFVAGVNVQGDSVTLNNVAITVNGDNYIGHPTIPLYGFNMTRGVVAPGELSLTDVSVTMNNAQNNPDSAALDHSLGNVTATRVHLAANGQNTYGLYLDSFKSGAGATDTGTVTFAGDAGNPNTILVNGDNSAGVNVDQSTGVLHLANTDITTTGVNSPGILVNDLASLTGGAGINISTSGESASGIDYKKTVTTTFDPSMSITTTGAGAHGFFADNADATIGTAAAGNGLDVGNISVQGQDAAAIAVKGTAPTTLTLAGGTFDPAKIGPTSWAAKADDQGTIAFTDGASTGGARIWAAANGTLDFNDATSDASGSVARVDTGGTLDLSTRTGELKLGSLSDDGTNGGSVNMGAATLRLDGSDTQTFHGALQGSGTLIMDGAGEQVLSGANILAAYTGKLQVEQGTLAMGGGVDGSNNDFVVNGGTLDVSAAGGDFKMKSLNGTGGTVQTGVTGASVSDATIVGNDPMTFSGTIAGDGMLIKQGTGTLTLLNAQLQNAGTRIDTGILALAGNADDSNVRFQLSSTGTLDISNATQLLDPSTGAQGARIGVIEGVDDGSGTVTYGAITLGAKTLAIGGAGSATFSGTISGSGSVIKEGSGTQTLQGANAFQFTGDAVVSQGVLMVRGVDPSTFTHSFVLNGGWLDLSDAPGSTPPNDWTGLRITDGLNAAAGGVIGSNDVVHLGQTGADQTEAGQLGGDGTDPSKQGIYVVKQGTNTLTLTGDNHYVGRTLIQGGTLRVSSDGNLGDTNIDREVVLDGGNLELAGSFTSARQIQLQQDGMVTADSGVASTWGSVVGAGAVLTKSGAGQLGFSGASSIGGVVATGGTLDLGQATVDRSGTSAPAAAAISLSGGAAVSVTHGSIASAGDAVVASGGGTLNLNSGTAISAGSGQALFRVTGGAGTLNANAQALNGLLAVDGAGSSLDVNLSNGSAYTGNPLATNGAQTSINVADASSTWNLTGDATVNGLSNAGQVVIGSGASASTFAFAPAAAASAYNTLTVAGNYTGNNGTIAMRTELNAGGPLSNQNTDRLLITGNASGHTVLDLTTTGSGASTNTSGGTTPLPSEGISLVQVGGTSTSDAFSLKNGYVAASGSPFQYRLFAYGPGSNMPPDPSQNLLPGGTASWDYRLQTACLSSDGAMSASACNENNNPGDNTPGDGTPSGGRPALVPQGSSYLVAPLAVQNYGAAMVDSLQQRLGDTRRQLIDGTETGVAETDGKTDRPEGFVRAIGRWGNYHSNRDWNEYGYDFDQDIEAMQMGGNWLHLKNGDQDLRLGIAGSIGNTSVRPKANSIEDSKFSLDAYNLALTGTWQHKDGWYVDGVVSAGFYNGNVSTSSNGNVGKLNAKGVDVSVEAGKTMKLNKRVELEPSLQLLYQSAHFDRMTDDDGISTDLGTHQAWTLRAGVRAAFPMPSTYSWKPYVKVGLQNTWNNSNEVRLAGQRFDTGTAGSGVILGVGADGNVTRKLSVYGEVNGLVRVGGHGYNNASVTLGVKYLF
jgi:outer membrane autotransporter protein